MARNSTVLAISVSDTDHCLGQGMRNGVAGTPMFFINGERYDGSLDERSLLVALRKRIPADGDRGTTPS